MKTASAKAKGREFQKAIAEILTKEFGWEEGDAVSRPMGSGGVDILLSPRARRDFPISVEAKKTKAHPSRAEVSQAEANAYAGTIGAVVWSPHRSGPDKALVIMDFQTFIKFVKEHVNEV